MKTILIFLLLVAPIIPTLTGCCNPVESDSVKKPKLNVVVSVLPSTEKTFNATEFLEYDGISRIRRLTPIECEKLQGFPEGWTAKGIMGGKEVDISDSQRYKCLGNAVTTNVVKWITSNL